jgi:hypothetical protein
MQVTAWRGGSTATPTYGIRVGLPNREVHFERDWTEIDVEIDGQPRHFSLTSGFWTKCPEFRDRDSVIREWLQRHHTLDWPKGEPPRVSLVPLGGHKFRLLPS